MANSEAEISSDVAPTPGGEYQVFLNFRGPDTRHGFTDFLYNHLVDAGVRVFRDNDELRVGEVIGENLLSAIDNSIIYIPIFSQTYASSKWCLRELAHIVDDVSKSKDEKSILPIFFDVEPDDVKLKTSIYKNTLSEHEREFPNEVEVWRAALEKVGKFKGWNVKSGQAKIVKSVVEKVLEKLTIKQKLVTEHLVGVDDRIEELTKLFNVDHNGVRLIGIYGMGGIGKTTIAKVIFNRLFFHFGKCCSFLEGIREQSTKEGMVPLQKKLLSDIDGSESTVKFNNSEEGVRRIGKILCNKKVLLVLDDVSEKDHIKQLLGNSKLDSGSRIIITTRDKIVLEVEGFNDEILPYEMLKMDDDLALELFRRHAFRGDFLSDDYHRLSSDIVSITGGLPLAIEVIGSLLNGKDQEIWEETLEKLRRIPEKKIIEKLRISYDDLENHHQQIFLDVACFFFNDDNTNATYMWTNCQFYPKGGIEVLKNRCLLKILDNGKFWMHDQLIALGRQIVREDSLGDLGKQSRLWIVEEALEIIKTEERKQEVQALELFRRWKTSPPIVITNADLERLPKLRFLKLNYGTYVGNFAKCGSKLRWLHWYSPPEKNFGAVNMYFDRLVVCKLEDIAFKNDSKAWDLIKNARDLKVLSIVTCSGIKTIPKISKCLGLERLTIESCNNLERIESFIGSLQSLIELNIKSCIYLRDLPEEVGALVKLKHFSLSECTKLSKLPGSLGNLTSLTELDLSGTSIRELPNSIAELKSLCILRFTKYRYNNQKDHVWQLLSGISRLVNLEELDLHGHDKMRGEIPIGIGELSSLRILNLKHTGIYGIPRTINMLHRLQTLELSGCHEIKELPELPTSLTCLRLESKSLLSVPNLSNLTNLVELLLSNDKVLGEKSKPLSGCNLRWIGRLSAPKKLELNSPNVPVPPDMASLCNLKELFLKHLNLETPGQLPSSLLRLYFESFSIRRAELLTSWLRLRNLSTLELIDGEVEDIPLHGLPHLEKLFVARCKLLQRLFIPSELGKLRRASVFSCPELVEIQVGQLKSLESLRIDECESLTRLDMASLCNLNELFLKHLNLETPRQLPSSLLRLSFESFSIRRAELLPSWLRLRNLSTLVLIDGEVEDIPLHGLPHLEKLFVNRCKLLQRLFIPSELGKLRRASVFSCPELVEIQVGLLKSLESLWIDKCESLTRLSGLSYLKNLENFTILYCNDQTLVEEFHELPYSDIIEDTSLRKLRIFLQCSREEILLGTSGTKWEFKVDLHNDKDKEKATKILSTFAGVYLNVINMEDQMLTVIGDYDDYDVKELFRKLRWMCHRAEISVGPLTRRRRTVTRQQELAVDFENMQEGQQQHRGIDDGASTILGADVTHVTPAREDSLAALSRGHWRGGETVMRWIDEQEGGGKGRGG